MRHFMDNEQITLNLICSSAFHRIGRERLGADAEVELARTIPTAALGPDCLIRNHGLGTTLSEIVDQAITLTVDGVSYDAEKIDALHIQMTDLCGGDFDETGEAAHNLDLQAASDEMIDEITGPLYALIQVVSCWGPHKTVKKLVA